MPADTAASPTPAVTFRRIKPTFSVKQYDIYLFDFDYTLADSSRGIVMCFRHVLNANRLGGNVTDDDIKRTIGLTLEEAFGIFTGITDAARIHELRLQYVRHADTCMTANTHLFAEAADVLQRLKARGARLGIISTKFRYRIAEFLQLHGLHPLFDLIIGGEDVTEAKPSPQGVLTALKRLGFEHPGQADVLYVGDSLVDAHTAQAAAVPFAAVLHGTTPAEAFAPLPHVAVMPTLEALLPQGVACRA